MGFLKSLLMIVVGAAFLYLAILNMNQNVTLYLTRPGVPTYFDVPLPLALLGAFLLGVVTWFMISIYGTFTHQMELGRLKKRNEELLKELADLRNMPLEGLDTDRLKLPETSGDNG